MVKLIALTPINLNLFYLNLFYFDTFNLSGIILLFPLLVECHISTWYTKHSKLYMKSKSLRKNILLPTHIYGNDKSVFIGTTIF